MKLDKVKDIIEYAIQYNKKENKSNLEIISRIYFDNIVLNNSKNSTIKFFDRNKLIKQFNISKHDFYKFISRYGNKYLGKSVFSLPFMTALDWELISRYCADIIDEEIANRFESEIVWSTFSKYRTENLSERFYNMFHDNINFFKLTSNSFNKKLIIPSTVLKRFCKDGKNIDFSYFINDKVPEEDVPDLCYNYVFKWKKIHKESTIDKFLNLMYSYNKDYPILEDNNLFRSLEFNIRYNNDYNLLLKSIEFIMDPKKHGSKNIRTVLINDLFYSYTGSIKNIGSPIDNNIFDKILSYRDGDSYERYHSLLNLLSFNLTKNQIDRLLDEILSYSNSSNGFNNIFIDLYEILEGKRRIFKNNKLNDKYIENVKKLMDKNLNLSVLIEFKS